MAVETMVERVARALYEHTQVSYEANRTDDMQPQDLDYADLDDDHAWYYGPSIKRFWRDAANHAIAALREPTEEMVGAVHEADLDIYWNYRAEGRPGNIEDVWRAMIDAALKEKG